MNDGPVEQSQLPDRATSAAGPVRGASASSRWHARRLPRRPCSSCTSRPGTADGTERVAVEHATTVLTMEIARLQHLAQDDARIRTNLVLDLVGDVGADPATMLNRSGRCRIGVGGRLPKLDGLRRSCLRRIRQVSGRDLGLPDVLFNLQVATNPWRTLQVLRQS
jgi:hypothetical protein